MSQAGYNVLKWTSYEVTNTVIYGGLTLGIGAIGAKIGALVGSVVPGLGQCDRCCSRVCSRNRSGLVIGFKNRWKKYN